MPAPILAEGSREHNPETVWKAQELYCSDRLSFTRIAAELDIADSTLRRWADTYNWRAKREQIAQAEADLRADKVLARSAMVKALIENKRSDTGFAVAALEAMALKEAEAARKGEALQAANIAPALRIESPADAANALEDAVNRKLAGLLAEPSGVNFAALRDIKQCLDLLATLKPKADDVSTGKALSVENAQAIRDILGI